VPASAMGRQDVTEEVTVSRLFDPPAAAPVDGLAGVLTARALRLVLSGVDEAAIAQELLDLAAGDRHRVAAALDRCGLAA
jgi:hypothetical protein